MTIGQRIKQAREAKGMDPLTAATAIREAGAPCREYDVWRWEADKNLPSFETMCAIAVALDMDLNELKPEPAGAAK